MENSKSVVFRNNETSPISYEELELMVEEAERHQEDEERVEKRNEIESYAFNNRAMKMSGKGPI